MQKTDPGNLPVDHPGGPTAPELQEYITSDNCLGCHGGLGGAPSAVSQFLKTGPEYGEGYNISPYGEWRWSPMGLRQKGLDQSESTINQHSVNHSQSKDAIQQWLTKKNQKLINPQFDLDNFYRTVPPSAETKRLNRGQTHLHRYRRPASFQTN